MSRNWVRIRRWVVGLFCAYVIVKVVLYFTGHTALLGWLASSIDAGFFIAWAYTTGRVDQHNEDRRLKLSDDQ